MVCPLDPDIFEQEVNLLKALVHICVFVKLFQPSSTDPYKNPIMCFYYIYSIGSISVLSKEMSHSG